MIGLKKTLTFSRLGLTCQLSHEIKIYFGEKMRKWGHSPLYTGFHHVVYIFSRAYSAWIRLPKQTSTLHETNDRSNI